ncbi:MAG TPA: HIT family protein [Phycisphaerae bacterium]|nr:HIT family protein [Phycisphaerae bacterium]
MSDCVFCRIAAGQIPAARIDESADHLAFLDIGPLAPGHTLLIPKQHFADIRDIPADLLSRLTSHLPRLARAVFSATGASGLNVLQNSGSTSGQAVFHFHIHLIPRVDGDKLGYRWNAGKYAGDEAREMQAKILAALA